MSVNRWHARRLCCVCALSAGPRCLPNSPFMFAPTSLMCLAEAKLFSHFDQGQFYRASQGRALGKMRGTLFRTCEWYGGTAVLPVPTLARPRVLRGIPLGVLNRYGGNPVFILRLVC